MPLNVRHYDADGATQLNQQEWGQIISDLVEVDATPRKFALENIDSRVVGASPFSGIVLRHEQVGTNDGHTFLYTAYDPNGTLSRPWGPDDESAPRVTLASPYGAWVYSGIGEKGVVMTAVTMDVYGNVIGETNPSDEQVFTITAETQTATYTWVKQVAPMPIPGGYRVYRRDGTGALGLIATVLQASDPEYVDDGTILPGAAPPADNTTGANATAYDPYGEPPDPGDFDKTDKTIATAPGGMAIGRQWFYYAMLTIPEGTGSVGNRRAYRLAPKEI